MDLFNLFFGICLLSSPIILFALVYVLLQKSSKNNFIITRISFDSKFPSKEVLEKLSDIIQKEYTFSFFGFPKRKPFMGSIEGNKINIERMMSYRGGYAPIISGEVIDMNGGSKINASISIEKVYIILWMVLVIAGVLFLGFLFPSLMVLMLIISIRYEISRVKSLLENNLR
jgi:hypothetical protein